MSAKKRAKAERKGQYLPPKQGKTEDKTEDKTKEVKKVLMEDIMQDTLLKHMAGGKSFQEESAEDLVYTYFHGDLDVKDKLKILEFMRDTAGQKPTGKPSAAPTVSTNMNITIDRQKLRTMINYTKNLADN